MTRAPGHGRKVGASAGTCVSVGRVAGANDDDRGAAVALGGKRCRIAADRARFDLTDYADPSREMCLIVQGYLKGTMYMNGYRDVAVEKLACRLWSDDRCAWRVIWKEEAGE